MERLIALVRRGWPLPLGAIRNRRSLTFIEMWNWPPAKIFMGDSGSTVLGGAVSLALLQAPDAGAMWWAGAVTAPLVGDAVFTHGRVSTLYVVLTLAIAVLVGALASDHRHPQNLHVVVRNARIL
jgi:UDP-N-acetylmuramyl pentapeptide phosphotransferase/UDP-N-acetylglucosamine-1-phosphate transferase